MNDNDIQTAIVSACPGLFRVSKESGDVIWVKDDGHEDDCDLLNDLNAIRAAKLYVIAATDARQFLSAFNANLDSVMDRKICDFRNQMDWFNWRSIPEARDEAEAFARTV